MTGRVCVHVRMCEKERVEGQLEGMYMKVIFWIFWGFPGGSVVKNLPANTGDTGDVGLIPGWERSPGEGNDNPLPYSCLGTPWTEEPGGLQSLGLQNSKTGLRD